MLLIPTNELSIENLPYGMKLTEREKEIQEIFKSAYNKAHSLLQYSDYSIKRCIGKNTVITDGIIEYCSKDLYFKMIQEIKFTRDASSISLKKQLAQVLMYDWINSYQNPANKFRCYFLINRQHFTYVYDHEILDLKKELSLSFSEANETPCKIHKNWKVMHCLNHTKIPFYSIEINKYFNLKDIMGIICKEIIEKNFRSFMNTDNNF